MADHSDATERTPLISDSRPVNNSDDNGNDDASSVASLRDDGGARDPDIEASRPANHGIGVWRGIAVSVSLWLLIFLQASNMSGMTIIQGAIAEDLDAHEDALWFTSAFLIPMSSLAPVAGRLATMFPPGTLVLPVSMALAIGGLVCAFAQTLSVFLAGRVIAGMGGAGVLTLAVIFVLELTSEKRRGIFIGLVNAGFTMGVSFGAVVFGGLMPLTGWRPLFWMQAPYAVLAGLCVWLSVPDAIENSPKGNGTHRERLARIDYFGATLLTTTIVLFLYGLAGDIEPLPLLISLATLVLFLIVEYRVAEEPIIPLKVLSSRGVLLSCLAQLGLMSARWSILYYAPIFMLAVRGFGPATSGAILIPTNVGFGLGGVIVGWLHIRRHGAYWLPSIISMALFSASLYCLTLVGTPIDSVTVFVAVVFVNGLAVGAGLNYTLAHALYLSHEDTQYVTTSLVATFRGFGGSFGTAIGGGIFYRCLRSGLISGFQDLDDTDSLSPVRRRLISRLLGTPSIIFGGSLNEAEQHVAIQGYAGATRGVWLAAAALGVAMIFVQALTGWTAPQKEEPKQEVFVVSEDDDAYPSELTDDETEVE